MHFTRYFEPFHRALCHKWAHKVTQNARQSIRKQLLTKRNPPFFTPVFTFPFLFGCFEKAFFMCIKTYKNDVIKKSFEVLNPSDNICVVYAALSRNTAIHCALPYLFPSEAWPLPT